MCQGPPVQEARKNSQRECDVSGDMRMSSLEISQSILLCCAYMLLVLTKVFYVDE